MCAVVRLSASLEWYAAISTVHTIPTTTQKPLDYLCLVVLKPNLSLPWLGRCKWRCNACHSRLIFHFSFLLMFVSSFSIPCGCVCLFSFPIIHLLTLLSLMHTHTYGVLRIHSSLVPFVIFICSKRISGSEKQQRWWFSCRDYWVPSFPVVRTYAFSNNNHNNKIIRSSNNNSSNNNTIVNSSSLNNYHNRL